MQIRSKAAVTSSRKPDVSSNRKLVVRCNAQQMGDAISRRLILQQAPLLALAVASSPAPAFAMQTLPEENKILCDAACAAGLEEKEMVTLPSGLQYRDIVVGKGVTPPVGYQVTVNYVAMTPKGRVFDSSLDKGKPYDIRVGAGQVIPGLDEGLKTMRVGGLRRLYIPGDLAFPKGLKAAAGRPSIPPSSPVMFDVQLLYIPGFDTEDEE